MDRKYTEEEAMRIWDATRVSCNILQLNCQNQTITTGNTTEECTILSGVLSCTDIAITSDRNAKANFVPVAVAPLLYSHSLRRRYASLSF